MRRPAAPGSARERDGRTRRAGAGRADAGKDRAKDSGTDRAEDSGKDRARNSGKDGGTDRSTDRRTKDTSDDARSRGKQPRGDGTGRARLPAQPGRADRETRRAGAAGKRPAATTTHTDGRGRRIGAGGVGAIPGSSGGSRTPRPAERPAADEDAQSDETSPDTGGDADDEKTPAAADAGAGEKGDDPERLARPTRPRPVRPAPHIVRRRRIALLVVVLVLLGGLAGGVAFLLYGSGLADVETVTVDGALAVPQDQVLAAAAVPTGGPLAGVDTSGAEQRVAALPGIASVTVGRDWPHTVVITVVERVAVALADTPKGLMLVDRTGVPYEQAPEVPPVLPHLNVSITGTIAPGDIQTTAGLGVLAALPDAVRSQVLTITVIAPAATGGLPTVELALSDDRRVVWGSAENSQRKAAVLTALLTEKGSVFDVASPDLPTIRR